jgi:hypothetical protein
LKSLSVSCSFFSRAEPVFSIEIQTPALVWMQATPLRLSQINPFRAMCFRRNRSYENPSVKHLERTKLPGLQPLFKPVLFPNNP